MLFRQVVSDVFAATGAPKCRKHRAIGEMIKGNHILSGLLMNIKDLPYTLPFLLLKGYNVQINNQF